MFNWLRKWYWWKQYRIQDRKAFKRECDLIRWRSVWRSEWER